MPVHVAPRLGEHFLAELPAGVLVTVGDNHYHLILDRLTGVGSFHDLGVDLGDHPPHGVVERGVPPRDVTSGIEISHGVEVLAVDENLKWVLPVELDQGDPSTSVLFPLLAEEGVETSDHVIGYRCHRP
jgi:hypothetical protein